MLLSRMVVIKVLVVAIACGQWTVLSQGTIPPTRQSLPCTSNGQPCSDQLCPNTAVHLTCNIPNDKLGSTTQWRSPNCSLELEQRAVFSCSGQSSSCPPFTAVNAEVTGPCNTSTLSFMMSPNLYGILITCITANVTGIIGLIIGSITLNSVAVPNAPQLSVSAKLNGLEVSCSSGDQDTYCNVTIQMNGAVQSVAANTTFNGLTSNMMYPISARAINRCGDYSEKSASHWTLPKAPPTSTIRVLQSLINESATQLNISWSHIGGNVSQYLVKSISGMNTFTSQVSVQSFCVALSCAYHQIVKTTGSSYTITISSINDGGVGPESDPIQGQSKSSTSLSHSVAVGVGIGISLLVIVICIAAALVLITYFMKMRSGHSYSTKAEYHRPGRTKLNDSSTMNNDSVLESNDDTVEQQVSQKNDKAPKFGYGTQFIASEDSVQNPSDVDLTLSGKTDAVITDKEVLAPLPNTTGLNIHSPPKKCYTSQNHQPNLMQDRRKLLKTIPHYIKSPHNGTVLTVTGQDGGLVFTTLNYVPDDTQLWYLDDQPDNTFMVVSKMNRMVVLACIENEIAIQERHGGVNQKWSQDNKTIVSSKYQTAICVKDSGNVPICVKKEKAFGHLCYLQSSLVVPMCLVDEDIGSVLEISDGKVIFNPNMDFTNLNQHWYIYPDSQRDNIFTVVSRKEEKALQLDDRNDKLIVKEYDCEEKAAQWVMDKGWYVVKNKTKRFKVYPMFRNYFMIKFQSCFLMLDRLKGEIVLHDIAIANKSMPFDNQLFILDMQQNGSFTMGSCIDQKTLLSNKDNKLVCNLFSYDDCQLWRRESNFIKSVKTDCYLCIKYPANEEFAVISAPPIDGQGNDGVSRPEQSVKSHPSLAFSCKDTDDKQQLKCKCATTKVVIQVSQIVHKQTGFVLSTSNDSSEVFMCPRNGLPHSTQFWVLDYRLDGTFLIMCDTQKRLVLSCGSTTCTSTETQLIMDQFNDDESQLWRFDGSHIESVKFNNRVMKVTKEIQIYQIVDQETGFVLSTNKNSSEVFLGPNNVLPHTTQFWILDYRPDGTVVIISDTKEKLVLTCDSIKNTTSSKSHFIICQFKGDDSQLWRFDGSHIESVKFKDHVISLVSGSQTSLCLTIKNGTNKVQLFKQEVSGSKASLYLSTKSATDNAQLFQQVSYTPVLIRYLMDDTVLELDDASVLKFSAVDELQPLPDSQVWYLKHKNGFSNSTFMIISKKNGQALQKVEMQKLEVTNQNETNNNQQWMWDGLSVVSQCHESMMKSGEGRKLVLQEFTAFDKSTDFAFQHFSVESYF